MLDLVKILADVTPGGSVFAGHASDIKALRLRHYKWYQILAVLKQAGVVNRNGTEINLRALTKWAERMGDWSQVVATEVKGQPAVEAATEVEAKVAPAAVSSRAESAPDAIAKSAAAPAGPDEVDVDGEYVGRLRPVPTKRVSAPDSSRFIPESERSEAEGAMATLRRRQAELAAAQPAQAESGNTGNK